jgi:hypothetical protein
MKISKKVREKLEKYYNDKKPQPNTVRTKRDSDRPPTNK